MRINMTAKQAAVLAQAARGEVMLYLNHDAQGRRTKDALNAAGCKVNLQADYLIRMEYAVLAGEVNSSYAGTALVVTPRGSKALAARNAR